MKLIFSWETGRKPLETKEAVEALVGKAPSYEAGQLERLEQEHECLVQVVGAIAEVLGNIDGGKHLQELVNKLPYGLEIVEDD
jgi:hypothetical protein